MEYNNLLKDIKAGNIKNIYLFFGQEQYLCEEAIKELEKKLIHPSFKDLNYEYIQESNISTQRIINACETFPIMDQWRVIIIKDFDFLQAGNAKKDEQGINDIIQYIKNISPSTCLVFWQTEKIDKRKKLFKAIKKEGKLLEINKLRTYELEKWLERKILEKGKVIKKPVLFFFMEYSNYLSRNSSKTLRDLVNEINKIVDYIGDRKEITKADIENLLPRSLEDDIFKMVDAIGKKDTKTAIRLLNDMLINGENGIKILSMVIRQFRILIQCQELKQMGYSPSLISSKLSLAHFIVKKGLVQSQYFERGKLKQALNTCSKMDLEMKTGKVDIKLALEMLIYEYTR